MRAATPLLQMLTSSGFDALGRVLLQVMATVMFARLLEPGTFGLAALAAVYVGVPSMVVTALFEEALAQRRRVRSAYFASALGAVLLLGVALVAVIGALSAFLPLEDGPTDAALSLASVYAVILFADGPLSIYTAIARRHRRFRDIALGNLLGLLIGTLVGLGLAWNGAGAWSLLSVQPVARYVNLLCLVTRSPVSIRPTFHLQPLRALWQFGGWHLAGRVVESMSELTVQTLVTRHFGLQGNGLLNMAMRIVEPIRGITGSVGHNIATAYYTRLQADPTRLASAVRQTIADTALLLQPVFVGLALTAPLIILVLAGPAWSPAAPIAILLALAAAVASASNFLHSGLSASGRADLGFGFGLLEWGASAGFIVLFASLGPVAAGLARLLAWLIDAIAALVAARRVFALSAVPVLKALGVAMALTAGMAVAVVAARFWGESMAPALQLASAVLAGVASYAALLLAFRRNQVRVIGARLRGRGAG